MATVSGFVTIADLTDGVAGVVVAQSNENHTFVAAASGAIEADEISRYSNAITVSVGNSDYTYDHDGSPASQHFSVNSTAVAGETYRTVTLSNVSPSTLDIEARISNSGVITLHDANTGGATGFFDASGPTGGVVTFTVTYDTGSGDSTITKVISISKAVGGSAPYIRMSANKQEFPFDFGGTSVTGSPGNVVLTAISNNIDDGSGAGVWSYQINGTGNFTTITSSLTGHTITGADTGTSTLTITSAGYAAIANLATETSLTYRFTRMSQLDQITVFKLTAASGGLEVRITSSDALVFKNNTGHADLTAIASRGGVDYSHANVTSYQWKKNGTNIALTETGIGTQPNSNLTNTKGAENASGPRQRNIRIPAGFVTDNGADVFSCDVVVPDNS